MFMASLTPLYLDRDFTASAAPGPSVQDSNGILPQHLITVDPQSFDVNVFEGTSKSANLVIRNDSNALFSYEIRARSTTPPGIQGNNIQTSYQQIASERLAKIAAASKKYDIFKVSKTKDFSIFDENAPYVEGELLVRFADDLTSKSAARFKNQVLASAGGGSVKKNFKIVPGLSVI